jgi:hypothetical protein
MDDLNSGWNGYTFVQRIDASVISPMQPGYATRVTLVGDFTMKSLYIGPVSARGPWIADIMYRLTWNGFDLELITDGSMNPVWTDAFPLGVDGSRGFLISGYIDPGGNGILGIKWSAPGWESRFAYGDLASDTDKSSLNIYTDHTQFANCIGVQDVDGYYTPPWIMGAGP